MISEDDSGLKILWDELCVQVQDEHFQNWDLLDDMVFDICNDKFNDLPECIQLALTYQTHERKGIELEHGSISPELAAEMLQEEVYQYAMEYENPEIRKYLDK